jgi:hypothetical protein
MRKHCEANGLKIRWFVENALELALRARLGERKTQDVLSELKRRKK